MVELEKFYNKVDVNFRGIDKENDLGKRIISLLENVIQRLPDEEQFELEAEIWFCTRRTFVERCEEDILERGSTPTIARLIPIVNNAIAYWDANIDLVEDAIKKSPVDPDGHSAVLPVIHNNDDDSKTIGGVYDISYICDRYDYRSDMDVMGVMAHELAEYSHKYNIMKENAESLWKMKDKARSIMFSKWASSGYDPESEEYAEHERSVNREAARLGFEKEIIAMDGDSAF